MRLAYEDLWNEAVALVRRDRPLLVALAGAFYFLPNLALALLAPFEPPPQGVSLVEAAAAYMQANWPLVLALGLVEMLGTLTMLNLFVKADGRTVAGAIGASLALLPTLFAASFFTNIMLGLAFLLLIVPGVYLLGRLAPMAAAIVAETRRNPFDAIGRSFALTRGHGFAVAGILVIVYILTLLLDLAVTRGLGSVAILLAGQDAGMVLAEAGSALIWSVANVLLVALAAVIYLRLRSGDAAPASR